MSQYNLNLINWFEFIQELEEAFGQEAIDISIFEKDKLLNSDVIKDYYSKDWFRKIIGISS